VYPGESPCIIWQESFSKEQGRNQVAQYWSYKAGSQESPFQQVLQTMQEIWGHAYHAHHQGLLYRYKNNRMVKAYFCAAKKAGKKPNPAEQLFPQLSKKLDKLGKTQKKASLKSKKRHREDSNSNSK
jgi:hypothetical protein